MDCTTRVAKTKALISCAVTAQLICVSVIAYAKSRFSHNEAHMLLVLYSLRKSLKGYDFRHIQTADIGVTLHTKKTQLLSLT